VTHKPFTEITSKYCIESDEIVEVMYSTS